MSAFALAAFCRRLGGIVALSLCCSGAFAQTVGLPIGSLWFSLGSEQAIVLAELKERYSVLVRSAETETYFVTEGEPSNPREIGEVAFRDGRLRLVQRRWGTFSGKVNSVDVSAALFAALESASNAAGGAAVISTKVLRVPGTEVQTIHFEFPGRKVTMASNNGNPALGGLRVSIDESVFLPQ
jgi:hypothetical protein